MSASDDTTERDLAGMEIVPRRHYDEPSVDLHDTTDAVAEAKRVLDAGHEGNTVLHALYEHAVDLEAKLADEREMARDTIRANNELHDKLAAVTRERDELRDRILTVAKGSWIGTNPTQSKEEILAAMERVCEHWAFAAVDRGAPRKCAENAELSAKYDRIEVPQTGDVTGRDG